MPSRQYYQTEACGKVATTPLLKRLDCGMQLDTGESAQLCLGECSTLWHAIKLASRASCIIGAVTRRHHEGQTWIWKRRQGDRGPRSRGPSIFTECILQTRLVSGSYLRIVSCVFLFDLKAVILYVFIL